MIWRSGRGCKDSELLITSHVFSLEKQHKKKEGGGARGGRESGARNESHMFPKMEAFQAARSGAPRAAPQHYSPTHGCAPSTRFHLAPLWRHEAQFTFAVERESAAKLAQNKIGLK